MDILCFCSVLCLLCLCVRLFICALWSPAGKGLTSWLSFVVSNCEFVTFPLYRLLIFAPLLTFISYNFQNIMLQFLFSQSRLLKVDCVLANSADLDEMPHKAEFYLGLHCLS